MKTARIALFLTITLPSLASGAGNATCPYVAANLESVLPGAWRGGVWSSDGKVQFPTGPSVISSEMIAGNQVVTVRGPGQGFFAGSRRTKVTLTYDTNGYLGQFLGEAEGGKRSLALRLDNSADGCRLESVTVRAPELGKTQGISYDEKLCRALEGKHLLDGKTARACADFERDVAGVIDGYASALPGDQAFVLFTTGPDGSLKLRRFSAKDYPPAAANVVADCLFQRRAATRPTENGGVERGAPASPLQPAESGVERGAPAANPDPGPDPAGPGWSSPAP